MSDKARKQRPVIGYVVLEHVGDFEPEVCEGEIFPKREQAEKSLARWNVAACEAMSDNTYTIAEVREIEGDE